MRNFRLTLSALAAVCILPASGIAQQPGAGSTAKAPVAKAPAAKAGGDFDPRDLNGIWYRTSRFQTFSNVNPANNFDVGGRGAADQSRATQEAPFTEAGRAKFLTNKPGYGPRAIEPAFGNDPMGTCDPLGVPRIVNAEVASSHQLWEFVVTPTRILQFVEWHHDFRTIFMDGRKLPTLDQVEPKWNGFSVGHWEGDTLVVDSMGFDERTWLDKFGYPHTEEMKLQERYKRVSKDTLELEMTLTDPEYYTRPWVSDKKVFKLNGGPIAKPWDEQINCAPSEEYKFNQKVRDGAGGKKN